VVKRVKINEKPRRNFIGYIDVLLLRYLPCSKFISAQSDPGTGWEGSR
jgi:hypothetical protein